MSRQFAICFDHGGYRRYLQFLDNWPDGLWGSKPKRFNTIEEANKACLRFKDWPAADKLRGRISKPYVVEINNQ